MSPHIIGPGLLVFVTQGTYDDIMVKELVCRIRVLGSAKYVHDLTVLIVGYSVVGYSVVGYSGQAWTEYPLHIIFYIIR